MLSHTPLVLPTSETLEPICLDSCDPLTLGVPASRPASILPDFGAQNKFFRIDI